ncbi:SRPBCC family protein [Kitasatospora sp. NPDC057223]|uniref:SRPBCC family protein n=1 Tax=Kitasatospora sp. NPDC057223 TaxID=3346055 RepID=UPI00363C5C43
MDLSTYRFSTAWQFTAAPARLRSVLTDVAGYPRWWPQVRSVRQTGERSGELVVRSTLPYRLVFTVHDARQDEAAGVLEAAMTGDLVGWSRWTIAPDGAGTRVLFEEEARLGKPWLRHLAIPARPLFLANHGAMMRGGERGLRAHLAAGGV